MKIPENVIHRENARFLLGGEAFCGMFNPAKELNAIVRSHIISGGNVDDLVVGVCIPERGPRMVKAFRGLFDRLNIDFTLVMNGMEKPRGPALILIVDRPGHQEVVFCELAPLLWTSKNIVGAHVLYQISLSAGAEARCGVEKSGDSYTGITCRGAARFIEHRRAAFGGKPIYRFHSAWADRKNSDVFYAIVTFGLSEQDALKLEEQVVDELTLWPNGLNMIPGGEAGLRWLAKHGIRNRCLAIEHRDTVLKGSNHLRSVLSATNWRSDEFARRVICGRKGNFDLETIGTIRLLVDFGYDDQSIAKRLDVRSERISRLRREITYSRVKACAS